MSFYDEVANACKEIGLECKVIEVPPHLRPTAKDYAELERNIAKRCDENEIMLGMSELYAKNSLPVQ